jgi:hypothetical protein
MSQRSSTDVPSRNTASVVPSVLATWLLVSAFTSAGSMALEGDSSCTSGLRTLCQKVQFQP